ncbi:MAG: translational GTPase TypA [Chlamydiia bacterium]|nr:translational GTPase TypA [Chlamydiia bacterium]
MVTSTHKIRNIAVIAHIDHGKTTLLDALLKQAKVSKVHGDIPIRAMDSNDQERERGITIFAKVTSIPYLEYKFNIVDTPGHADFSGEVERVLDMVNSVLLLVDAREGPMPQTRYVLNQALKRGYRPIVVINKIDRPNSDPERALNRVFDLFVELGATDEQLDFSYIYCSGYKGYACHDYTKPGEDMTPLLDLIISAVPAPQGDVTAPFVMQVATVTYNSFLGRGASGRIINGRVSGSDLIIHKHADQPETRECVGKVQGYWGLETIELEEAAAGDIVTLFGIPHVTIGDILADPEGIIELEPIPIEKPTLSVNFLVNSGPFAGTEGSRVSMNHLRERLLREKEVNITLKIEDVPGKTDRMLVSGRGELQLAVLIESMRREGYEMCISKPRVITQVIDEVVHEPIERLYIEASQDFQGAIIERITARKGRLDFIQTDDHGITRMEFLIPTRGLLGWRDECMTLTGGTAINSSLFQAYEAWKGNITLRNRGALIAAGTGRVTAYACFQIQDRGNLFVAPGDQVYEGMVVGEHCRDNDLIVNITREKALTNVRAAGKDDQPILTPPKRMSLEQMIGYIAEDEWVEITPVSLRMRKAFLKENDRKRQRGI